MFKIQDSITVAQYDQMQRNFRDKSWMKTKALLEDKIWYVLEPCGTYFISDLQRDMIGLMREFLWLNVRPTAMRQGVLTLLHHISGYFQFKCVYYSYG
jgi:hypothetical protein